jgi:predicted nicotinamide N-methyase
VDLGPERTFEILEVLGQPRPSHWARVWPTSIAMSRWLLAQAPGSLPSHATELGCGMGLVGVTLAHLGIVTRGTDREPLALEYAARNAARNGVVGYSTSRLEWSEPSGHSTQLVVASDIVYELGAPEALFALLEDGGLLGRSGRLLLGVPQARTMLTDELVARLRAHGYGHALETSDVDWNGELVGVNLHLLTRPA